RRDNHAVSLLVAREPDSRAWSLARAVDSARAVALLERLAGEADAIHADEDAEALSLRFLLQFNGDRPPHDLFAHRALAVDRGLAVKAEEHSAGRASIQDHDLGILGNLLDLLGQAALPPCKVVLIEHHHAALEGDVRLARAVGRREKAGVAILQRVIHRFFKFRQVDHARTFLHKPFCVIYAFRRLYARCGALHSRGTTITRRRRPGRRSPSSRAGRARRSPRPCPASRRRPSTTRR